MAGRAEAKERHGGKNKDQGAGQNAKKNARLGLGQSLHRFSFSRRTTAISDLSSAMIDALAPAVTTHYVLCSC